MLHAIGATSVGPVLTAAIQLVSVPVFLHFWGPKLYGEWLVLSAIPIYLGLTDFGFGSVAATEMTMQVARGGADGRTGSFSKYLAPDYRCIFIDRSMRCAWALGAPN